MEYIRGFENEPECGKRCQLCHQFRLQRTFEKMRQLSIDKFTTTLPISPHKESFVIQQIGNSIDSNAFCFIDFKKKDGFKHAIDFAKQNQLYRQNYCGCVFSNTK